VSELYEFGDVDTFTTGALGQPGQRVFLLQVRAEHTRVTVKCEKQQVSALAEYLRRLLQDVPTAEDQPMRESLQLVAPAEAAFVVGPIGLAYDSQLDRFVLMLEEMVFEADEDDEDDDDVVEDPIDAPDPSRLRLHLTRGQALAFCAVAEEVVAAGRPNCLFCGRPMDPDGHPCPRMN
jgi:uncharacterized repeat protein (TIGR03847 family)